ncbi:hypothetical protein SUGI_0590140 [Cryptomeria japonica]|uniref:geraniol 8-hydroxylase n=1 Tax=Cryptomeria japonica TaxID=3369 RepID=UPI002414A8F2|nr:geraniol 8-hydroxylase [Cryptomeria japonica]GLJ29858.1 hypothetical protein SUGI_0590140 [Cryptomeria japonica]
MDMSSRNSVWYYWVSGALGFVIVLIMGIEKWRSKRLPPGPFALPLLGHLHLLEPNVHECLSKISQRYGPLMTLKFGMKTTIVVSSSAMAKEILKDNDQTFANRSVPVIARRITYDALDILWSPNGPRWRLLRKICVKELFSTKSTEALQPLRREEVRRTIGNIYKDSVKGIGIDVGAKAFTTSLNLITNMMWSISNETDERGVEFKDLIREIVYILGVPNASDLFPFLERLDVQGLYKRMQKVFGRFDKLFDRIIQDRVSGKSKGQDFLQSLLDLVERGVDEHDPDSVQLTMKDVKILLLDMVSGSTDTTSNIVEWAMAELLQQPEIMKRAQKELEQVVGLDNIVEESHLSQLPYLDIKVKEVLRLHPALPLLAPHRPEKDCEIGGYLIPKDTQVLINVWSIQRNPQVWKDPSVFDPERFADSKWDYNGRDFDYFPFGSGRRSCAGISMANIMVNYALASLLHSFDWSLPVGEKLNMAEKYGIVLRKAVPLVALPKPRLLQPNLYD